jgi:hypothetical protein
VSHTYLRLSRLAKAYCVYHGAKRTVEAVRYSAVSAEVLEYRSIVPWWPGDNECDRAGDKKTMAFRQFTKFVADLNPGYCSLGAESSNVHRVEATP